MNGAGHAARPLQEDDANRLIQMAYHLEKPDDLSKMIQILGVGSENSEERDEKTT